MIPVMIIMEIITIATIFIIMVVLATKIIIMIQQLLLLIIVMLRKTVTVTAAIKIIIMMIIAKISGKIHHKKHTYKQVFLFLITTTAHVRVTATSVTTTTKNAVTSTTVTQLPSSARDAEGDATASRDDRSVWMLCAGGVVTSILFSSAFVTSGRIFVVLWPYMLLLALSLFRYSLISGVSHSIVKKNKVQ